MNRPGYESLGRLWSALVHHLMTGLVIAQLLLLGLMGLKKAPAQSACMLPLLLLTFAYLLHFRGKYGRALRSLAMHDAAEQDEKAAAEAGSEFVPEELALNDQEHNALRDEAGWVRREVQSAVEVLRLEREGRRRRSSLATGGNAGPYSPPT